MYIVSSMLKNKLYLFDRWLSKDRNTLLIMIVSSTTMIQFESTIFYGIGLLFIICFYVVFVKAKILDGQWKFDKSLYTLPIIDERIIAQKDFKYDFTKVVNSKNYIHQKFVQNIDKGFEFDVIDIEELNDNWIIKLKFNDIDPVIIQVFWLDVKDYFMTVSQIREDKLKKLLK